jgi:anti-anti-sigma factor
MKITTSDFDNHVILKTEGSLSSEHTREFESELKKLFPLGKHILLDFSELVFISSSILTILLSVNMKAKEENLKLILFGVNKDIMKLFSITEIDAHLSICKSKEDAVRGL